MAVTVRATSPYAHLLRLTDATGVLEHAEGAIARREHGYCLDEDARALIVAAKEESAFRRFGAGRRSLGDDHGMAGRSGGSTPVRL